MSLHLNFIQFAAERSEIRELTDKVNDLGRQLEAKDSQVILYRYCLIGWLHCDVRVIILLHADSAIDKETG